MVEHRMTSYMAHRRASNPLQKFQDKRDNLKQRIKAAKTWETLDSCIDAYGRACLELEAARLLYKKNK